MYINSIILIGTGMFILFIIMEGIYMWSSYQSTILKEKFSATVDQDIYDDNEIPIRKGKCKDEQTTCPERYEKDKTKLNKKCVGYECTTEECCVPILGKCKDEQMICPERYEKDETKLDKTCAEYKCTSEECCTPAPYKLIPGRLQLHSDYIFSRAALPWQAAADNAALERERKKCEIAARNAKSEAYTYSKYYGCRIQKPDMDYCDRTPTRVLVGKRLKLVANPTLQSDIDQYCYMDEGYHREANLGRMGEYNDGKFFYSIRPDSDTYYKKK